jgi:hypothetical protein
MRIDEHYIAQRSIPSMRTLSGLKIALMGCGTIGGYLADMLAKRWEWWGAISRWWISIN